MEKGGFTARFHEGGLINVGAERMDLGRAM